MEERTEHPTIFFEEQGTRNIGTRCVRKQQVCNTLHKDTRLIHDADPHRGLFPKKARNLMMFMFFSGTPRPYDNFLEIENTTA